MRTRSLLRTIFAQAVLGLRMGVGAMAFVVLAGVADHAAAEGIAPLGVQESGPSGFEAPCNYGEVLSGLFIISDGYNFLDISPQCAKASNPSLKIHAAPERWHGGDIEPDREQWPVENPACPDYAPILLSIRVETVLDTQQEIKFFRFRSLQTSCGVDASHPTLEQYGGQASTIGANDGQLGSGTQFCPAGQVAVGVHGRTQSSYGLSEIGLLCGDPKTGYNNKLALQSRDDQHVDTSAAANRAIPLRPIYDSRATPVKQPMGGGFSRLGRLATPASAPPAGPAVPPAEQPPAQQPPVAQPPVAQAPAKPGNAFMPPTFIDGAQLWACANAVQGKVKGSECSGLQAGRMYCRRHGFSGALQTRADGTPDLMVATAQPGRPVRAVNGEACNTNNCAVVSELHCAP